MSIVLDFERPLVDLRRRLTTVEKELETHPSEELQDEQRRAVADLDVAAREIYGSLSRWQKVQVARHPQRPQTLDYAKAIFTDFVEMHGDRNFGDDQAIVAGPARLDGRVVMLIGQQRGHETRERVERNFGEPHPEGYRKALRLFRQAEKYDMPVITLVDTPGASPGLEDEQRGQAWALAENIMALAGLRVPVVSVIIGEGASGGALALCVADRLLMFEHSVLSVATPEAAAAMLWRDSKMASHAAESLRVTAQDAYTFDIVDRIIPEPPGGAHASPVEAAASLRRALVEELAALDSVPVARLLEQRYQKYRRIGPLKDA